MTLPTTEGQTRLIRIGNSRGVRLPKHVLDASGLDGDLTIEARPGEVVLRAARHPRAGWTEAFTQMAQSGDDTLLDPEISTEFDRNEWQW